MVGEAGWPCVRESSATAACVRASSRTASISARIEGASTRARASRSIIAYARLLTSSDVHAKWTNSRAPASSCVSAIRSRMKYSTAFTS